MWLDWKSGVMMFATLLENVPVFFLLMPYEAIFLVDNGYVPNKCDQYHK